MEHKYSKGYTKYGADMGRSSSHAELRSHIGDKLKMSKVRLDAGGYDNGGAYWGGGPDVPTLWRVSCEATKLTGEYIEFHVRGNTRAEAIENVRATGYVNARFYKWS